MGVCVCGCVCVSVTVCVCVPQGADAAGAAEDYRGGDEEAAGRPPEGRLRRELSSHTVQGQSLLSALSLSLSRSLSLRNALLCSVCICVVFNTQVLPP